MTMTFEEYDKKEEAFEKMPDPSLQHGITEKDIDMWRTEPDVYIDFAIYMLTRSWYAHPDVHTAFINADALPQAEAKKAINKFLIDNIEFTD